MSVKLACQDFVDILVSTGLTAIYTNKSGYQNAIQGLDKHSILVYIHDSGEDVIFLGDNEIDTVRLKFGEGRKIRE